MQVAQKSTDPHFIPLSHRMANLEEWEIWQNDDGMPIEWDHGGVSNLPIDHVPGLTPCGTESDIMDILYTPGLSHTVSFLTTSVGKEYDRSSMMVGTNCLYRAHLDSYDNAETAFEALCAVFLSETILKQQKKNDIYSITCQKGPATNKKIVINPRIKRIYFGMQMVGNLPLTIPYSFHYSTITISELMNQFVE